MCLISVGVERDDEEVGPVDWTSSLMGIPSKQLNIFMALKELVDHSNTTPSREPDANKFAGTERREEEEEEDEEEEGGSKGEGRRRRGWRK